MSQRLFQAILAQACTDLLSRDLFYKKQALDWFEGNSSHFRMVCELTGFDPDMVRTKAIFAMESDFKTRKAPGTGARYIERDMSHAFEIEKGSSSLDDI